jgi:4-hydroxythreonine-4-phosphate dehydrogenase
LHHPRRNGTVAPMLVVSTGCPSGVGPEVSVAAAAKLRGAATVLVGNAGVLARAAALVGVPQSRLRPYPGQAARSGIYVLDAGPALGARDARPGKPGKLAGQAQLEYVRVAYELVHENSIERALVTGPVSKGAIATSGAPGAADFRGHTEYLEALDGAAHSTMCFAAKAFATSLVTTHISVKNVPRGITADGVCRATLDLVQLVRKTGVQKPHVAVASLNPHAGEGEMFGREETLAILPGVEAARRALGRRAVVTGPIGAETAYRKAAAGIFHGVVAMYHDQATIPMKLIAFGEAVNVTMGLSVVRTSVDHGTGYDIAWQGTANAEGMLQAMRLALKLGGRP